jgi:hypothetical protein
MQPKHVATSGGIMASFSVLGYQLFENPEAVAKLFGDVAHSQIAQAGFFFTVAAWLHAGRVKKEISLNFTHLTDAINKVSDAFRADLSKHSETLKNQSTELAILSLRVQNVENNLKTNKEKV